MGTDRILQVVGRMDRGGTEALLMELFRNIDRNEIMFDFMVHTEEECAYDEEIRQLGGKIFHVPRFKGTNIISYKKAWNSFFKKHEEYKIIHGHIGSSAAIYLAIAKKHGCYTIAHSHSAGLKREHSLKSYIYRCFNYPTRFIADYFLACSLDAGIDRYGKNISNSSNFFVLHNGINIEKFRFNENIRQDLRKDFKLKDKFIVGTTGRMTEAKNPLFIIDIFHEIKKLNKNAFLLWCGDGELRTEIEIKIKDYQLENDVELVGAVSNVNDYMQVFDVFLFPSLWEGLGISLIEAQAASLPCFISDVIPQEGDLTNLVHRISLKKTAHDWAKIILKEKDNQRINRASEIARKGYSIKDSVKLIGSLYRQECLNVVKENKSECR